MTVDKDQQLELMREIIRIARDEFYVIGIGLEPDGYGIVRNDFKNVPGSIKNGYTFLTPGPTHPEQYFVEG